MIVLVSKGLQTEVVKEVEHDVAVEQHDSLSGDPRGVLEHEARDFLEGTIEDQLDEWYLLLACGDAVRVELASLEVREEQLSWGGGV